MAFIYYYELIWRKFREYNEYSRKKWNIPEGFWSKKQNEKNRFSIVCIYL